MQFHALGSEDGPGAGRQDRGRRLEEEEGLFRAGIVQFGDVLTG